MKGRILVLLTFLLLMGGCVAVPYYYDAYYYGYRGSYYYAPSYYPFRTYYSPYGGPFIYAAPSWWYYPSPTYLEYRDWPRHYHSYPRYHWH